MDAIAAGCLPIMWYDNKCFVTTKYNSNVVTLTDIISGDGYMVTGTKTYTAYSGATFVYQDQGVSEAGKFLVVGNDGIVTTVTMAEWQGGTY